MMTDYRTMLSGLAALQAAAATAAVEITVRSLEFALREGELVTRTLVAGQPAAQPGGRHTPDEPMLRLVECFAESLRGFACLPRVSALIFLGELDRVRGRRAVPPI
jgi:hypothetical protein